VVLSKTPFYAESGGQMGDTGNMLADNFKLKVLDTVKSGEEIIHIGEIVNGDITAVKKVTAIVSGERRQQLRLNHTATHLMHEALRQVLGDHVQQAGSLVAPDRLRFDLTHYERISEQDICQIESIVNDKIRDNIALETELMEFETARKSGAAALFGEKYGDEVRVVNIPGFSKELCGGTHVDRTGDIGGFKIISETALSSGVRRIEAITGIAIDKLLNDQQILIQEVKGMLKCADAEVLQRLKGVLSDKKELEKELKQSQQSSQGDLVKDMVDTAEINGHLKIIIHTVDNVLDLKDMGDSFRQYLKTDGIALIGTVSSGKPMVMCAITDNLTNSLKAGDVVQEVGKHMGGGGGGKPHLATAGGKDSSKLSEAMAIGKLFIEKTLGI
jgi:alanyl-tRNA synthetase